MGLLETYATRLLGQLREGVILAGGEQPPWPIGEMTPAVPEILGRPAEALLGQPLETVFRDRVHPRSARELDRALATGHAFQGEIVVLRPDGGEAAVFARLSRETGVTGPFWVMVLEPLEALRSLQRDLAAERAQTALLLKQIREGVVLTGPDGRILRMNRAAEALSGWKEAEALQEPADILFRLIDGTSREPLPSPFLRVFKSGLEIGLTTGVHLLQKNGQSIPVAYAVCPLMNAYGVPLGMVGFFHDEMDRLRMQEAHLQQQRLEAVSMLAGGIAHDFNNLLTSILGNLALCLESHEGRGNRMARHLLAAEQAAGRARNLSQQLLALSRGNAPVLHPFQAGEVIRETAQFTLSGSPVSLKLEIVPDLWPCLADEGKVAQVINNLVLNARQAMPSGGTLTIRAVNIALQDPGTLPLEPGNFIRIEIADTGTGISPGHLPRIFDPFFTTRKEGTGLGLANCQAIVRQHGGHIFVESTLGEGATFTVYLPAAADALGAETKEEPTDEVMGGEGRILVMDDESLVRQIMSDLLQLLGYEVEFAETGEESLVKVQQAMEAGKPFVAAIVDLTVPGNMGGLEARKHMEKIAPDLKVIVSSGYNNDPVIANHREHGFAGVVVKPFTLQQLGRALRDALEKGGRPAAGRRSASGNPFKAV